MAYRFTNTDKWGDAWFSELRPIEKLLFNYLCDNCDIAGFIEVTIKKWAMDIGTDKPQIEGALKGLERCLTYSDSLDCVFINNFLKHQKNLPLNDNNKAHIGIIKRFEMYKLKFGITDINTFIGAPSKGLSSPTGIGIGIGNGSLNKEPENQKNWRNDYETYLSEIRIAYSELTEDKDWIKKQELYHPKVNIPLSIEKACVNYWATDAGWKKKKRTKSVLLDWRSTLTNAIDMNKVYK